MSHSLSKIYLHIIFHIKNNDVSIRTEIEEELYAYMASHIVRNGCTPIKINGIYNHVHICCTLSRTTTISQLVEDIKKNSSRWLKTKSPEYRNFSWQSGYAAFSISESGLPKLLEYISNQKTHHQEEDSKSEYVRFLKAYHVDYDEKYLWED